MGTKWDNVELERLYDWITAENLKPAITAFTAGELRDVAREIEYNIRKPHPSTPAGKDGALKVWIDRGGDDYTNGVFDFIVHLNQRLSVSHLKDIIYAGFPPSPQSEQAGETLQNAAVEYADDQRKNHDRVKDAYYDIIDDFKAGALWQAASQEKGVLGLDNSYPLSTVLSYLIKATEYLLHKKDYDGSDYEEMEHSIKRAKEIIQMLSAPAPDTVQGQDELWEEAFVLIYGGTPYKQMYPDNIEFLKSKFTLTKNS